MTMLVALEARLKGGEGASDDNGYFVRTTSGKKLGPMEEYQFNALRHSSDVTNIASAWRMAGGNFYKIELHRKTIWDAKHACSLKAWNQVCELIIIIVCFACTIGVFVMLLNSKDESVRSEMDHSGKGTLALLSFLFFVAIITAIATVVTLLRRWRAASTEVFVSEV